MLYQGLKPIAALLNRACCTAWLLWHLPPLLLRCLRSYLRKDGHAACVLSWALGVYGFKLKGHLPPSKERFLRRRWSYMPYPYLERVGHKYICSRMDLIELEICGGKSIWQLRSIRIQVSDDEGGRASRAFST